MSQDQILDAALALAPKVAAVATGIATRNIGRGSIIHATLLSLVSGRRAFFLGPFGVNKTGTVQALAEHIKGAVFYDALMPAVSSPEQLLVEHTSIEETIGANNGIKSIRTRDVLGRAAAAHIVFADEMFKAERTVLNALIDLSKGGSVRHEGQVVRTPLMAFLAASNELPAAENDLGAVWSRMTIRVQVKPLDWSGKKSFAMERVTRTASTVTTPTIALEDIQTLRAARSSVMISEEIIDMIIGLYTQLIDKDGAAFDWLFDDDRRFGRVFDVLQASALLAGRPQVTKPDVNVLEFLLWDTPEQIPVVKELIAPLVRTPLLDAQELIDTLLLPDGVVATARSGDKSKLVAALTQFEETDRELDRLVSEAAGDEKNGILGLRQRLAEEKQSTLNAMLGTAGSAKR